MNSVGEINPRTGWCQRTRASSRSTRKLAASTIGCRLIDISSFRRAVSIRADVNGSFFCQIVSRISRTCAERAGLVIVEMIERPSEAPIRSEEHTSELQSLMRISYAVFCLKKKKTKKMKAETEQQQEREK